MGEGVRFGGGGHGFFESSFFGGCLRNLGLRWRCPDVEISLLYAKIRQLQSCSLDLFGLLHVSPPQRVASKTRRSPVSDRDTVWDPGPSFWMCHCA